ncbi:MAG: hypothetical protein Q9163_000348 [Psora crenata]
MADSTSPHNIVILGASFAGLGVAHGLLKAIPALQSRTKKTYKVTVISNSTRFWWSIGAPRAMLRPYPKSNDDSFIPVSKGLAQYPPDQVHFIHAEITGLDTDKRVVLYKSKNDREEVAETTSDLHFDTLVVAVGTTGPSPIYNLHGSHVPTLKAYEDIQARLPHAKTVLVVGGGPAGTETAGELGHLHGKHTSNPKDITILSGNERLLPALRPAIGRRSEELLAGMGVKTEHYLRATEFKMLSDGREEVTLSDGSKRAVDVLLVATGRYPASSFLPPSLLDSKKRVMVDAYLRIPSVEGAYALGDNASCLPSGVITIKTQVPAACSNIIAELSGEGKGKEWKPMTQKETQLVTIGPGGGVGSLFGWWLPSFAVKTIKSKDLMFPSAMKTPSPQYEDEPASRDRPIRCWGLSLIKSTPTGPSKGQITASTTTIKQNSRQEQQGEGLRSSCNAGKEKGVAAVDLHFITKLGQSSIGVMSVPYQFRILLLGFITQILIKTAVAQGVVVTATAAWSSQIVAFWGAILIAVRSSVRGKVTNALSSIYCNLRVARRVMQITGALSRGNWFLHSGWHHGELQRLALQVSMQIEAFAFNEWEVLVLGKRLKGPPTAESTAHWIKSPHHESLCPSRVKHTGENMFPLNEADIAEGIALLQEMPKRPVADIVQTLSQRCNFQATRCAYVSEMYREMHNNETQASFANVFTKVDGDGSPYQSLEHWTGQYGSNRGSSMKCASRMYVVVHIMVAAAIGLMGAASGRGLAVWLLAIRPALQTLGTEKISGDDTILSLTSTDGSTFQYETGAGSPLLAGDITSSGLSWWYLGGISAVPIIELLVICAGWLYGALRVQKFPPSGVVGHGMLWLSTLVWFSLSVRALMSIRQRLSGRIVGLWRTALFTRMVVGTRSLEVAVDRILNSPIYSNSVLGLVASILCDGSEETDESSAVLVAECALRRPGVGTLLDHHLIADILKFQYLGDSVVLRGEPPTTVNVRATYPWFQTCCCITLTMLCGCVSVIYAYYLLPSWVKMIAEVLLAVSASWFGTLERTAGVPHNMDTTVCFTVATLVASSVWYVGVRDVG